MGLLKIRCSQLGNLMTEPRTKVAKEAGELSETSKTHVKDLWLKHKYGYEEPVYTEEMKKGLLCEQDSMALAQEVLGGSFRTKCRENIENDFITGTPDIVVDDYVEDIKTSFTVKTFMNAELTKLYEYQLRGYMALTGKKKARLIYCLVNTPVDLVQELTKRFYFKFDCDETNDDFIRIDEQIRQNHDVNKIPAKDRVKVFNIEHDEEKLMKIYAQVSKARNYYKTLKL